jgi:hypothetical protein
MGSTSLHKRTTNMAEFQDIDKNEKLDKIRHFRGSVQDLKDFMDAKAGENTNSMDNVEFEYPNKKNVKDTSPVYQTYGIVKNPIKENIMIKKYDEFVAENIVVGGFAAPAYPVGSYGLGWGLSNSYSGYDLRPVAAVIDNLSAKIDENAKGYQENENPDHTAVGYLKEANKAIKEKLRECYEKWSYSDTNESFDEMEAFEDFDAAKKNELLKKRSEYNKQKLDTAKAKGNKNSEELYKLKMELDKIDLEKTKIKAEIQKLKDSMKTT